MYEVPMVLCEQCGEPLRLEARVAYNPVRVPLGDLPETTRTVIFTAEKCRCPDQPGS